MKISIIVPVYNVQDFLIRCLDSLCNQIYTNIEIILVDDGSTDSSGKICDEYSKKDDRIRVIHKQNEGLSKARNTGMDIASGDYIGFVDSDDYIELDMYKYLYDIWFQTKADIVCCGIRVKYTESNVIRESDQFDGIRTYTKQEALWDFQLPDGLGAAAWNKIYRKDKIRNIRFREVRRHEDRRYVCECLAQVDLIAYGSDVKYVYEIRKNSITTAKFGEKNYDIIVVSKMNRETIEQVIPDSHIGKMAEIIWNIVFLNEMIKAKCYDKVIVKDISKNIKNEWRYLVLSSSFSKIRLMQLKLIQINFPLYAICYKIYCVLTGRR